MSAYTGLGTEEKIRLYRTMLLSRHFEKKVNEMFMKGMIHGTTHLGIGQEANHAALSGALRKEDIILPTHRGHGHFLGKGGSPVSLMAELFGLAEGVNMGLGGSMHLTDMKNFNLGASGIVAGALPAAVGAAFALKKTASGNIIASLFGDGAANQGMALESFNLAAVWQVPLLFYCENNLYAMSSSFEKFIAGGSIPARAESFGIKAVSIDGNSIADVYNAVTDAAEYIRNTGRPFLIESRTYRQLGHSKSDQRKYRTPEEEAQWAAKCPVAQNKKYLTENRLAEESFLDSLAEEVIREIEDCAEYCRTNKDRILASDEALRFAYADEES